MVGCSQIYEALFLTAVTAYSAWVFTMKRPNDKMFMSYILYMGIYYQAIEWYDIWATYSTSVFTMKPSNGSLFTNIRSFIFNCCTTQSTWVFTMKRPNDKMFMSYILYMGIYYQAIEWWNVHELHTLHGYLLWSHWMVVCSQILEVLFSTAVLPTLHGYLLWSHRIIGYSWATYSTWVFTMKPSNDRIFMSYKLYMCIYYEAIEW